MRLSFLFLWNSPVSVPVHSDIPGELYRISVIPAFCLGSYFCRPERVLWSPPENCGSISNLTLLAVSAIKLLAPQCWSRIYHNPISTRRSHVYQNMGATISWECRHVWEAQTQSILERNFCHYLVMTRTTGLDLVSASVLAVARQKIVNVLSCHKVTVKVKVKTFW